MRSVIFITLAVLLAVSGVGIAFTFIQANKEEINLTSRVQSRTQVLSDSLSESIESALRIHATSTLERLVNRFVDNQRLSGIEVFDSSGVSVSRSTMMAVSPLSSDIATAMDSDLADGRMVRLATSTMYLFTAPLHSDTKVIGAISLVQNATYIDETVRNIWRENLIRLFIQIIFIGISVAALVRFVFLQPLMQFTQILQSVRKGGQGLKMGNGSGMFKPLALEMEKFATSLHHARSSASEEARMRFEKLDSPWTAGRLQEFVKATLKNRPLYVVSNREPYVHEKKKGVISYSVPASGLVTALESVMEACGGTWLAHGSGSGDKETASADGKISVPPDEPKYVLKRLWLTDDDVQGFYTGFSNEALWPLCHMSHIRPLFRKEDWVAYKRVNGKFAKSLLDEIKDVSQPIVFVQDYHFSLLPEMIKKSRPDAQIGIFWHIPWPSAEQFSICPWRKEILTGMLGADIIGFHTQQHCNNFMETIAKEVESLVDFENFTVTRGGHTSHIKPFPISVAFTNGSVDTYDEKATHALLKSLGIETEYLVLGVDRLDYTKGILERLKAIEYFLDTHTEYKNKFTFLQIASPSRESVAKYREYTEQVLAEVERINKKFKLDGWEPIVFEHKNYPHTTLRVLYRAANVCLVTSLHDGMNLVAKEYVSERNDDKGVLILSQFAGAAKTLRDALTVNPYSAEETGTAIYTALHMSPAEQHRRMKKMRTSVKDFNVYRWSAEFLKALSSLG